MRVLPLLRASLGLLAACASPPPVESPASVAPVGLREPADPPRREPRSPDDALPRRGASHQAGAKTLTVRGHYGVPILGKSVAWDGQGEMDNFGLGAYLFAYVTDGFAIGGGMNGTVFKVPGADEYGLEIEAASRFHPFEIGEVSVFFDLTAGWVQATGPVPPGGTEWNMSFSFGPGVDIPIAESTSLQLAAIYHHMSNALGRESDQNPSQNEGRFWAGVAWNF